VTVTLDRAMPPSSSTASASASSVPTPGCRYAVTRGPSLASTSRAGTSCYDTLRYNFKPASATAAQGGRLMCSSSGRAQLCMPSAPKSTSDAVFDGNSEAHRATAFALICDADGQWHLERLARNVKNLVYRRSADTAPPAVKGGSTPLTGGGRPLPASRAKPPPPPVAAGSTEEDADVDEADLFGDDSS